MSDFHEQLQLEEYMAVSKKDISIEISMSEVSTLKKLLLNYKDGIVSIILTIYITCIWYEFLPFTYTVHSVVLHSSFIITNHMHTFFHWLDYLCNMVTYNVSLTMKRIYYKAFMSAMSYPESKVNYVHEYVIMWRCLLEMIYITGNLHHSGWVKLVTLLIRVVAAARFQNNRCFSCYAFFNHYSFKFFKIMSLNTF